MLHHADYKDDMPDAMYGMQVALHGVSQVSFVKVYRFPVYSMGAHKATVCLINSSSKPLISARHAS